MADMGFDGSNIEDIWYYNSSASTENVTFCCDNTPSSLTGSTTTWYVNITSYTFDVVKARLRIYEYMPYSPKIFHLRSSGNWQTITSSGLKSFTESLYVVAGDIIGIEFELTNTSGSYKSIYLGANDTTSGYDVFFEYSEFINGSAYGAQDRWDEIILNQSIILYTGITGVPPDPDPESGGNGETDTPSDVCRGISGTYKTGEYFDNYWGTNGGYVGEIDIVSEPDRAMITVEMPWGYDKRVNEIILVGTPEEFINPDDSNEHYTLEIDIFAGSPSAVYDIIECWWKETLSGNKYVKTGGNDSNFGNTWNSAYKTITKGAQSVGNNGLLSIEEGTYNNETQIQPTEDNATYNIQPSSHTEAACTVTINLT